MFENIIAQAAADRLRGDIEAGILAPSMLFYGPAASGKGTAALELGRVLSCGGKGGWNCPCPHCARHKALLHPDLLLMGRRAFAGEIAASAAVLPRDFPHGRLLLIRSVRKLLGRFSPALWEGDRELGKLNPLIQALEDDLEALEGVPGEGGEALGALGASIIKNALKLEAEGIAEFIPVAQVRRASYWGHLAPLGRRKLLVIENADRMKEEALNSLLKILEEPPERLTIVLCTARKEGILPTLLSRLRPYRFTRRDAGAEGDLIRRVFRDKQAGEALAVSVSAVSYSAAPARGGLEAYLDSFLPVNRDTLYPLAAFFVSSVALAALDGFRRRGIAVLPDELVALGKHCAPIAASAGLGRPAADSKTITEKVLAEARNFQIRALFSCFLALALELVSEALRPLGTGPRRIVYLRIWKESVETAAIAGSLNQSPALTLDRLVSDLKGAIAGGGW
ncbi:MAG: DNA polymerase III [Treponema sp.]|jgi:DNA polymerase-3 subunit gamma/tau|nr:DNA polymerase III [Treponema sp.]